MAMNKEVEEKIADEQMKDLAVDINLLVEQGKLPPMDENGFYVFI